MKILYKMPSLLLYSRLVVSISIVIFSFSNISPKTIAFLSIYAIVSDIFDGIIARYLKISTIEMRQLDTKIDAVFWFSCLFYICINYTEFLQKHFLQIGVLVFSEIAIIVFGFLKFQERISYHTIFSKFWALLLLWFFIDLLFSSTAQFSFSCSFWYGLFVQLEIIIIAIILDKAHTDVPNLISAVKLKKGIKITKNRIFND